MHDKILWEYLEELTEQEGAWCEWFRRLSGWHCFNTFYIHYMKVNAEHARFIECTAPCEHGCRRQVVEDNFYNIAAICIQQKSAPVKLKFKDILIYSLRLEAFHQAVCASLQIERPSGRLLKCRNAWYLGEYYGTEVYLTYKTSTLTDTISSINLSLQKPFILMVPTVKNIIPEIQRFMDKNSSVLFSMADELTLQPDGSFKSRRSISECMKLSNLTPCQQAVQST